MQETATKWKNPIRLLTSGSLFDGHDAAINVMRRLLQSHGAEVIHLGHNRSVQEIVEAAIQEDVQGVAITSYQGGHVEFFQYMFDLFKERKAPVKIFGGGGGTILPTELDQLHRYGISRLYSPDDGRKMGLSGMIEDLLSQCDFSTVDKSDEVLKKISELSTRRTDLLAKCISVLENLPEKASQLEDAVSKVVAKRKTLAPVLGVTGTGGAGKSSLVDELVRRFRTEYPDKTVAILSVDPSKRKTGGALLGDRIRMNAIFHPNVFMRSFATRAQNIALSRYIGPSVKLCQAAGFDLVIVETSGIGQSDSEITAVSDVALYVMTPEYGAATQLEKIDMIDFADLIAINKFDKRGGLDSLRDVRKQVRRSRNDFETKDEQLPVLATVASVFNDPGTTALFHRLIHRIEEKKQMSFGSASAKLKELTSDLRHSIIPPENERYLAEIADGHTEYKKFVEVQSAKAQTLYCLKQSAECIKEPQVVKELENKREQIAKELDPGCQKILSSWEQKKKTFSAETFSYEVRGKKIEVPLKTESLSGTKVPRVSLPKFQAWGDILRWSLLENLPGEFPYTAGVFPVKRQGEDPARMFAGEGGPERTNHRFHYLSEGQSARRLSTAFDSVTLYGEDPHARPDIYGKVGNSGVSIATVDDAKKLYSGFDLVDPKTSVSMTINGPAPMILAYFFNAAIDQGCEKYILQNGLKASVEAKIQALYKSKNLPVPTYHGPLPGNHNKLGLMLLGVSGSEVLEKDVYEKIKKEVLQTVRGTVQADILKEDQAQNTCIFSTEFALRMMGDVQQYFIDHNVRNFYSVSISGYHIAEAGANPITQLALTLANGFTYVEYYLSRGMPVDAFAPNLSFFFSNGMDPEYSVIGRVARRIWARAIRDKYQGNDRSQKLKYHIQTSGRSLHAQEIAFNDIRTTLQALYAIYDNCNSLHTNAYDEAITTPTEESVRRALAIQLIINQELGLAKNENPLQGSFIIEELTDLVEEAVMMEFRRISDRGGVLGAMERMYQRSKIQDESLYYETKKHTGEYPLVGVNTFLDSKGSPSVLPKEVIRANKDEKEYAIQTVEAFKLRNRTVSLVKLKALQKAAIQHENLFDRLMDAAQVCSLGELSQALYEVGGQYRRNM